MSTWRQPVAVDEVAVVGGGALGLAAALRLARAGRRVVVIEREKDLGGLAAGFRPGDDAIATLEKFYHHLFKTDRTIVRHVEELGLSDRLVWDVPVSSLLRGGNVYPMSVRGVLGFAAIPPVDRVRFGATVALLKLLPGPRLFGNTTAAGWMRRWAGRRAYEGFVEPQLRGKFGGRAGDVTMSWLWSRFHERTLRLGYLRGGFQQLYDALGDRIRALGGSIELGTPVESIAARGDGVDLCSAAERRRFGQVLVTAPQRVFEQLAQGLPAGYTARYPGPDFFSAHVLILALDRQLTQQYWISIGDPGFPFLVAVEHTNFMPPQDYGGRHLVYLGNYLPNDAPLLRKSDDAVVEHFLPGLRRLNPDFDPAWIQERWVFKAPFAQPIVTSGYVSQLPRIRTPLPGVYLATMAHVYPQDRGQNYSMALGERVADAMLRDTAGTL
jgi:protoporphyrinogen oxidase